MAPHNHLQRLFARLRRGMAGFAAALFLALPILPTPAEAAVAEFHRGGGMVWTIADIDLYNRNKPLYDSVVRDMSKTLSPLRTWLGEFAPNPFYFHVGSGGCVMSFLAEKPAGSKGRVVQFGDSCVAVYSSQIESWLRPNVLLWTTWEIFTAVSGSWPEQTFWYPATRLLQTELLRISAGNAEAERILAWDDTEEKRKRVQFLRGLQQAHGWAFLPAMLAEVRADKMDWNRIVSADSALRINYVMAYQSLALNLKVGNRARDGGIREVSNASVMQVLRARNLLAIADRKGKASGPAWEAFRTGKPDQVLSLLPSL